MKLTCVHLEKINTNSVVTLKFKTGNRPCVQFKIVDAISENFVENYCLRKGVLLPFSEQLDEHSVINEKKPFEVGCLPVSL